MKTKFTLLVAGICMLVMTANAGTKPAASGKNSTTGKQEQLRNLPSQTHVAGIGECGTEFSHTDALSIPDNDPTGTTASITVTGIPGSALGSDVYLTKIHVAGHHTYTGDVVISLMAPNGIVAMLMNRPGQPATAYGCQYDDFSFDVIPGTGHDNETTCFMTPFPPLPPSVWGISGTFTATAGYDLDALNNGGGDPNGSWTLFASDNANADTGAIDTLTLYFSGADNVFTYTISSTTVYFTAPTHPGALFGWDFGDGNQAVGSSVSNTYAAGGSYTATMAIATLSDTCITAHQVNPAIGIGIPSVISYSSALTIAPNPSSGLVDISIGDLTSGNAVFTIYDSYGRNLKTETIKGNSFHRAVDMSQWSKGVYFVKVMDKNFTKVQKLILK